MEAARTAQAAWRATSVADRLRVVRRTRDAIACHAEELLDYFPSSLLRTRADSLTSEIIPLAEACRFLELEAADLLSIRRLSRKARPRWLSRVEIEVHREPFGVVLVIGPGNYPLFLPGVHALQALVAGNAVFLKPGVDGRAVIVLFAQLMEQCGLPADLFTVLDESIRSATGAIESGADKVIFTGSVQSGRAVLRQTAERPVPVVAELSGHDAVFVQSGADLERAAAALAFGLALNGGATCIAPRRVFVHRQIAREFQAALNPQSAELLSISEVKDDVEALKLAAGVPYALGATIFGEENTAKELAAKVRAGVVVVNDMIVPTADPRLPFGGRGWSGFGTTRGAEGLLEMTTLKAVAVQQAKRLRHLEAQPANAEKLFLGYLSARHRSGLRSRWAGWRSLFKAISGSRKVGQ
jgi:acyl-CoA reductase-like NAD-dependent aldehyde dehydrogenase